MIDLCVIIMGRQGLLPETEARALVTEVMPRMKRRQKHSPQEALEGASCGVGPADQQC